MYKYWVPALLLSYFNISFAAEAILIGEGQVISSPDYVEMSIIVDSKCYPTPGDARKVNDEASRKIVDFLNTKIKKKDAYNIVVSTGGFTLPYQTYYQERYLCQNTFQKQNVIVFKTQDLKEFEGLFNEIQNVVYKQFDRTPPSVIESSISFVTMSDPTPGISIPLRSKLEQKALTLAYEDAKEKLFSLLGKNTIQNLKLVRASEISPEEPKPIFQARGAPMMMGARMEKNVEQAPVQFDEQNISKTIYFEFKFDDIVLP